MGFLSRLFNKQKTTVEIKGEPVKYKGFFIYQEALAEGGQYRIAGRITKPFADGVKTHRFIRSDVLASKNDADEFMLQKAQMLIDQMGDTIFQ